MDKSLPEQKIGTRHRAGLGISELTDALAVIVSEETGEISLAENGELIHRLDRDMLKERLVARFLKEGYKLHDHR
jgi:diadenylate cyclase